MSFKNLFKIFSTISCFIIFIPHLLVPVLVSNSDISTKEYNTIYQSISNSELIWPIPGYTRISSPFGKRNSPTGGASTYHQGIDIPAPPGTNLIAPCESTVTFTGFNGSGGYSIRLKKGNIEFVYHHVSPDYSITKGQTVLARSNYWTSWT